MGQFRIFLASGAFYRKRLAQVDLFCAPRSDVYGWATTEIHPISGHDRSFGCPRLLFSRQTGEMSRKPFKRRERPGRCLGSRSNGVSDRGDASEAVQMARVSEAKTARKMRGVLRAQIGRPCRDVPALLQVKTAGERPKLSDPAHGTPRLQPRRSSRVRCSAWLACVMWSNPLSSA